MHRADNYRAFADRTRDPLNGTAPHVPNGEDTWKAGLERQQRAIRGSHVSDHVPVGEDESPFVTLKAGPSFTVAVLHRSSGLYFVGLTWQHTRGSALLEIRRARRRVARREGQRRPAPGQPLGLFNEGN